MVRNAAPVTPAPIPPWRSMPWFSPDSRANMLVPGPTDLAWTVITQAFNEENSPGETADLATALTGTTSSETSSTSTSSTTTELEESVITNFPSSPNTVGDRGYVNPITCTQTPITANTSGQVLPANTRRTLLIVQNNSTSGGATIWVAFGQTASEGLSIGLAPGQSLTLDASCPRDSVNLLITGASGTTQGVLIEGSFSTANTPAAAPGYGTS